MKIKLNKKIWILLGSLAVIILVSALTLKSAPVKTQTALSQEDLAKLVKPAVVRIIQHTSGQATVPAFDLDLQNFKLNLLDNQPADTSKVDEYLSGSGFVVNSNGYILTNAHVVSEETVKDLILDEAITNVFDNETKDYNADQLQVLSDNSAQLAQFETDAINLLETKSIFNIKSELTVLNPTDTQEFLAPLLQNGFNAEIVNSNQDFLTSQKDVALIKISAANLPTLKINSDEVAVGTQVYAFGFPATAEFNQRSPLESSLTKGLVSSIKFSDSKEFKILQTDAKISEGSSGGPLFNDKGEAVGLITFQTGSPLRSVGDNFAFAVPVSLALPLLDKSQIANSENNFAQHFKEGLSLSAQSQCTKALAEFGLAIKTNSDFISPNYLESYNTKCAQGITSGNSTDNIFITVWIWIKSVEPFIWFVILGRLMLIALAVWILYKIAIRLKTDENQLANLEAKLADQSIQKEELISKLRVAGTELPLPEYEMHLEDRRKLHLPHPGLADYINQAREIGLKDEIIKEELIKAGWDETEILHTFQTLG